MAWLDAKARYMRIRGHRRSEILPQIHLPRKDPEISSPLAVTLSEISMVNLVLLYLLVEILLAPIFATGFYFTRQDNASFWSCLGLSFSTLWAVADPLGVEKAAPAFYPISAVAVALGLLLPLILLGSFVFKLFKHDPLRWRNHVAVADYQGSPVFVVRFYNRSRQPLANLQIDVIARVRVPSTSSTAQIRTNIPLNVIRNDGSHQPSGRWIYSLPGVPFSVRIPLNSTKTAAEVAASQTIPLDGYRQLPQWEDFRLLVMVTGTSTITGSQFTSIQQYDGSRDFRLGRPSEIHADDTKYAVEWRGWENFDMPTPVYLFGYGSLISKTSAEETIGHSLLPEDGPLAATLIGYRRAWNLGSSKESHPERTFFKIDGSEYSGVVLTLGIERSAADKCLGVVIRIRPEDVRSLLRRERNYDLIEVTSSVQWESKPDVCTVYTFTPSSQAIERLQRASEIVLRAEYIEIVEQAIASFGSHEFDADFRESVDAVRSAHEIVSLSARYD